LGSGSDLKKAPPESLKAFLEEKKHCLNAENCNQLKERLGYSELFFVCFLTLINDFPDF
jgi:hypothetical protein